MVLLRRKWPTLRRRRSQGAGGVASSWSCRDRATVSRFESTSDSQPMGKQTERLLRLMVIWEKPVQSYPLEEFGTEEPKSVRMTLAPRKGGWDRQVDVTR